MSNDKSISFNVYGQSVDFGAEVSLQIDKEDLVIGLGITHTFDQAFLFIHPKDYLSAVDTFSSRDIEHFPCGHRFYQEVSSRKASIE